ncbi:MAG: hypothetical protein CHACPFDD_00911 [Phycisphaerae bacterium]|nr:hypothetical protein [Phycisphaerae bacterium]
MSEAATNLAGRIRELRRRQFGARGRGVFAERVGVSREEYAAYEAGRIPPADVLVRMCEVTGEDLQWLLTGLSGRGTLVISGARDRHQQLLSAAARLLHESPESAGPLEAFIELLQSGQAARAGRRELPPPTRERFVPILEPDELGETPPAARGAGKRLKALSATGGLRSAGGEAWLCAPSAREDEPLAPATLATRDARAGVLLATDAITERDALFAVRVADDDMAPMLRRGDVAIVSCGRAARPGRPALCRLRRRGAVLRIWLPDGDDVRLGRAADGGEDVEAAGEVCWSLEVLYCVRPAA